MSDNKKFKGRMNEQLSGSNLGKVAGGGDKNGVNPVTQGAGINNEMDLDTDLNFDFKFFGDDIKNEISADVTTNIAGNNSIAKIDNKPNINISN